MRIWLPDAIKQPLKRWLSARRQALRVHALERERPHVDRTQLAAQLRALGVEAGDTLFVHSSLKSLGFVEGGASAVFGALRDSVGPQGTLVLPAYWIPGGTQYATCEMTDYVFDPNAVGTNMGAMPAAALSETDVRRSIHPTHSCAAVGPLAKHLTEAHHLASSVFGVGSPWERFSKLPAGKVLGLGISMGPVTFYHLVEDTLGKNFPLPVWLEKEYSMPCKDWHGNSVRVPVRPLDPAFMPRRIDHKSAGALRDWFAKEFEQQNLKTNGQVGQAQAWLIPGPAFLEHLVRLAGRGITIYSDPNTLPS